MNRQKVFPFTAIIGQDAMKKALLLNVINPKLGGVLICLLYTSISLSVWR